MDEVRTERLLMRGWNAGDAEALAGILTPPVTEWLSSWPNPMTPEIASARIASMQAIVQQGRGLDYAIVRREDDRVIAGVRVDFNAQRPKCAKLGYYARSRSSKRALSWRMRPRSR